METSHKIKKLQEPEESQQNPKKPLAFFTDGALIGWILGVSTNGVFNFFSDSPAFQLYPFFWALCIGLTWLVARLVIIHNRPSWLFMVLAITCVTCLVAATKAVDLKKAQSHPKPFLILGVAAVPAELDADAMAIESKRTQVALTNKFLRFTNTIMRLPDASGHLLVPVPSSESKIKLRFSVMNDSPIPAENVTVKVEIADNLSAMPADEESMWERVQPTDGYRSLGFKLPTTLLGGEGRWLPSIIIRPGTNIMKISGPIFLAYRSTTTEAVSLAFYTLFATNTPFTTCQVVLAKGLPEQGTNMVWIPYTK
jgi:hypothetical protein